MHGITTMAYWHNAVAHAAIHGIKSCLSIRSKSYDRIPSHYSHFATKLFLALRGHDPLYAGNLLEALPNEFRQIMPMYSIQEEQYYAYDGNEGDYSNDYENVDSAWKASSDYSEDGYYDDDAYDAPEYSDS